MPIKICQVCKAEFFVPIYRNLTAKYCSNKCKGVALGHDGSKTVACVVCGKEHHRPPSHLGCRPTCSMKCRGIADRKATPEGNDIPFVRKWMRREGKMDSCTKCGYSERPQILVVHHIDRDRGNNKLDNLEVLCPNCHALEHYWENVEGWDHASTARNKQRRRLQKHLGNGAQRP